MEYHQDNYSIQDNEEEEEVALQGRQSKLPSQNNNDDDATAVVVPIDGNRDASSISRSGSSTISSDVDQSHSANGTTDEGDQKDEKEDVSTVHSSVYFDQLHGAQSIHGVSDMKASGASYTISEIGTNKMGVISENFDDQNILTKEINHQSGKILDDEGFSGSTSSKGSFVEQSIKSEPANHAAITAENFEIIEEIDEEGTDFDVEKVLEKQNTHDLYCPNCHSCITRKVILHRRRRKIRTARRKPKQDKLGPIVGSEKDAYSTAHSADDQRRDAGNIYSDDGPTAAADDDNRERDPDVFRCLACFSFFIPTGDGFKLFPAFGDKKRDANVQDSQKIPAPKKNWWFSIFTTDARKTTAGQDGVLPADLEGNAAIDSFGEQRSNQNMPSPLSNDVLSQQGSNSQAPVSDGVMVNNGQLAEDTSAKHNQGLVTDMSSAALEADTYEQGFSARPPSDNLINSGLSENDSFKPQQGANSQFSSTHISVVIEQSEVKMDKTVQIPKGNEKPVQTDQAPLVPGSLFPDQLYSKGELIVDDPFKGAQMLDKLTINIGEKAFSAMENKNTGNDVVVTIEKGQGENAASQRVESIGGSAEDTSSLPLSGTRTDTPLGEQRDAGIGAAHEWEVLKSIVYGGLAESLTSLGVVTSAASSGAATLNVLALGLANLIGGLFIIGHNLVDLKNDHDGGTSSEPNQQEDRYRKTLGRRENFLLHSTIAILSFLIFGLLPPVIYGFSFRKSDNRDLKLAAVGGASVVCIILLAIGKAHVQRQPKKYISTVFYYVSVGVMTSGASYIAGDLLNMLLQKLGWTDSEPGVAVTLSSPTPKPFDLAWASY